MLTKLFSTDALPVVSGGGAGVFLSLLPTWEGIIATIVLATIGATMGYLVKMFFDWVLKK